MLTRDQLAAAIGRLETYINQWGLGDPVLGEQEARRKRDELASRYMQDWAEPIDDPTDAIVLLARLRDELQNEAYDLAQKDDAGLCFSIAVVAREIIEATLDRVVQKSFEKTKQRWLEKEGGK